MKTYQKYTIFTFVLGILVLFSSYFTTVSVVLTTLGLIYLLSVAYLLGEMFFGSNDLIINTILGFLVEIFIIIIVGSVFFYFYKLNSLFFVVATLGLPLLVFLLRRKLNIYIEPKEMGDGLSRSPTTPPCPPPNQVEDGHYQKGGYTNLSDKGGWGGSRQLKCNLSFFILVSIFLIATAILFYILISHSTLLPIRTPWEVLPKYFFAVFFVNTLTLVAILLNKKVYKSVNYKLVLISIYLFLFSGVAYFIYKLGYGFDPFIHRATLDIILKTGTITPKPLYYIGEYGLLFYLSKLLGANINTLEKILVPLLAAISLPATLYHYLDCKFKDSKFNWLIILSLFLVPLGFLIVTTPQNLANLFLIILVIFSLNYSKEKKATSSLESPTGDSNGAVRENYSSVDDKTVLFFLILNTLAIFFIHPIAGIPAFLFLILLFLWHRVTKANNEKKILNTIYGKLFLILTCFGIFVFPVMWLINSAIFSQAMITVNSKIWDGISLYLQDLKLLSFGNFVQFKIILNIIYFFYFNLPIILIIVFALGLKKVYREKKIKEYMPHIVSFLIFFCNYLILKIFINFGFLINYERDDYTNRVLQISILFLVPFLITFVHSLWEKIRIKNFGIKYTFIIILPFCLCMSLYFAYPRHDNFTASHGYNTSKYDIMAVDYIDKNSNGDFFIVLTNQQVSAAALQEFGFKKYYDTQNGKLFYYPIPTGNALYGYYLEMVTKKPTRETMESAMRLAGVKEGYFVVNKYWWESQKIIDLAKLVADKYFVIGKDDVYIFKFVASNNTN